MEAGVMVAKAEKIY